MILTSYDFLAPQQIVFGWGRRVELGLLAKSLGQRAFVISGSRTLDANGAMSELLGLLTAAGLTVEKLVTQTREPEVSDVDAVVLRLRDIGLRNGDLIVAVGGGSAIDLAKAVAALATNDHGTSVRDFLESVGRGLKLERPPLPLIAMPTTAGTGTEATKNAVISSFDPLFKKSLRHDFMIPKIVLVDPELTVSLPRDITAHSGMDAITQLIESLISRRAKPIPRALCWQGLELAIPAMFTLSRDLTNRTAREAMSHAALLSGMSLANSGLGVAHGVAAALGVHAKVPHGLACAVMLPTALQINRDAAQADLAQLGRLASQWLIDESSLRAIRFESPDEMAVMHFQAMIRTLNDRWNIPQRLSTLGISREQLPELVSAAHGNSLDGNPHDISDEYLHHVLTSLL